MLTEEEEDGDGENEALAIGDMETNDDFAACADDDVDV